MPAKPAPLYQKHAPAFIVLADGEIRSSEVLRAKWDQSAQEYQYFLKGWSSAWHPNEFHPSIQAAQAFWDEWQADHGQKA